jgi:hypothetical protein
MNDETVALLMEVVGRLEESIRARNCPAMIALEGTRRLFLSDYDYLRDEATAHAFERRAAGKAQEIDTLRWVLAVPQVWVTRRGVVSVRAVSNHPLRLGEQEAITWMSFDREDGVDYGRVAYARRPDGDPVFDEPEMFTIEVRPAEGMPGITLLHALLDEDNPTTHP